MKLTTILPGAVYQRGHMLQFKPAVKQEVLREANIGVVVALWGPVDPGLLNAPGLRYVHLPMADGKRFDPSYLEDLAGELASWHRQTGAGVLSHCQAGRNRSGMMNALLIRELQGVSGAEALRMLREVRPRAVANPYFEAYLDALPALKEST